MPRPLIYVALLTVLMWAPMKLSAQVYKWVDSDGTTHYSTTPPSKDAAPAMLPPIIKEAVSLPKATPSSAPAATCDTHHGVNCDVGPDTDGSVICYDGFRDAATQFKVSCLTAKLEFVEVSPVRTDGSFTVTIRNRRNVGATGVEIFYQNELGKKIKLKGLDSVDSLGTGEFIFVPTTKERVPKGELGSIDTVRPGNIAITCANCG